MYKSQRCEPVQISCVTCSTLIPTPKMVLPATSQTEHLGLSLKRNLFAKFGESTILEPDCWPQFLSPDNSGHQTPLIIQKYPFFDAKVTSCNRVISTPTPMEVGDLLAIISVANKCDGAHILKSTPSH